MIQNDHQEASPFFPLLGEISTMIQSLEMPNYRGSILEVGGAMVRVRIPQCRVGQECEVQNSQGKAIGRGEVIGFDGDSAILSLYGSTVGLSRQSIVIPKGNVQDIGVGKELLGRTLNGFGELTDIQSKGTLSFETFYPLMASAPEPMKRQRISRPFSVGVRAIDGLLTCGEGQRIAVLSAAGVGKSTLLSSLVLGAESDVNVIALIGERGREVREFIEENLGDEGMKRSVVIVSTSDRSSLERLRAAYTAMTVAEFFRDQGMRVLFLMDSVTRFARAQREIGLAAQEPPTRRGFPPSVFTALPQLVERAGMAERGSITAFFTVLVEGDDMNEPIADEVRSLLDGHIVMSRDLASQGHYPAIDVLKSVSRVMTAVVKKPHIQTAQKIRELMAAYERIRLLVQIGEYKKGGDKIADQAVECIEKIQNFLKQGTRDMSSFKDTISQMEQCIKS